jgi:hypothetical protein
VSSRPNFALSGEDPQHYALSSALTYIWDVPTLSWVKNTGGGGGGGGAVTVADGADVAEGSRADVAWVAGNGTVISLLKTIASSGAAAGLTDAQLRATPVPVSGTVTTTPPANASTNVAQMAGTAVSMNTGVRDAGTQRVTVATNDSVPVTGAFFQATQPISGTVTTTPPANASTNLAQIVGTAADVNSGVKSAGTLRVVLATDQPALTNKLLVTPDSVALPANQSVNAAQFGGTNVVTGTGAGGSGIPRVTVSNDSNVIVTPPTLTKGTQGATGFSVQDLKDSGRVNIAWTAEFAFAQTAETLLTVTESRDGAATATFTTKVVTSGKRLRITSMFLEDETLGTGTTVPQRCYLRMRFNTAGAVTTASPLQAVIGVAAEPPAILKTAAWTSLSVPDGIEFLGDGTKQIGFTLETPDWVVTTQTGRAKVTITAFEY